MTRKPSSINVRNQFNVSNRTQRGFVAVAYREAPVESPHGDGWLVAFASIEKRSDSIATLAKHVERLRNTGRTGRGVSYLLFDSDTGQELDWSGKPKVAPAPVAPAAPVTPEQPRLVKQEDADLGGEYVQVPDALGAGVDAKIYRERGVVSVVLVDSYSGQPVGASAELNIDDVAQAMRLLGIVN